ncbi:MAG: DNA primase [Sphingomonas sp.]|nr:MAG: DNA primase [Sphingomonas sp.]
MAIAAKDIARELADRAEAVCRQYLSNGRRQGGYWMVGNVRNDPGRSMFVRLANGPNGPAGKWTDAATGEHGDLIDVIQQARGLHGFIDAMAEARRFLSLPDTIPQGGSRRANASKTKASTSDSLRSALRLFAMARPIEGTLAATYLRGRGIVAHALPRTLRFHPECYYRPDSKNPTERWPAMLAAVTDIRGNITGIHRTWLQRDGSGKAPVATPRRAMGHLLANGVRFGAADDIMAVGEGIETMLSIHTALPDLPVTACLSAAHLAAFDPPASIRRLYIANDRDAAGLHARDRLAARLAGRAVEIISLSPRRHDFNDDLCMLGLAATRHALQVQLAVEDAERLITHII